MTDDYDEEPLVRVTDIGLELIALLRDGKLTAHRAIIVSAGRTIDERFGKLGMLWVYHMIRAAQKTGVIPPTDPYALDSFTTRGLEMMWDGIGEWRG